MDSKRQQLYFVAAVLTATLAGGAYLAYRGRLPSPAAVATHTEAWPSGPRTTAALMQERYGVPNVLSPGSATWYERGPWKRIVIRGEVPENYLEQAVSYRVPYLAVIPLFEFGHGVRADSANNELSIASGSEALNLLALNLADEIASGKTTANEARDVYARTARPLDTGKSSPYTEALQFTPHKTLPEDSWRRVIGY